MIPLATEIGYDRSAELAHKAYKENRTVREVVLESGLLSRAKVDELLELMLMDAAPMQWRNTTNLSLENPSKEISEDILMQEINRQC